MRGIVNLENIRTGTRKVRISLSDPLPKNLSASGTSFSLYISIGESVPRLLIPKDALIPRGKKQIVYLFNKGLAKQSFVKTGVSVGSKIEILKIERKIKHFNVYKNNHVDRRLESKLTVEEFNNEYAQHGRPVLIYMDESKSFINTYNKWKKKSLLSNNNIYKDLYFDVSKSSEIAPSQNFAVNETTLQRIGAKRMNIKDYIID